MPTLTEDAVLKALSTVQEPELGGNLISRNMVKDLVIDGTKVTLTIELTGDESKISAFLDLMEPFGIRDITRTGKVAMPRK